jgi:hypothetical protein
MSFNVHLPACQICETKVSIEIPQWSQFYPVPTTKQTLLKKGAGCIECYDSLKLCQSCWHLVSETLVLNNKLSRTEMIFLLKDSLTVALTQEHTILGRARTEEIIDGDFIPKKRLEYMLKNQKNFILEEEKEETTIKELQSESEMSHKHCQGCKSIKERGSFIPPVTSNADPSKLYLCGECCTLLNNVCHEKWDNKYIRDILKESLSIEKTMERDLTLFDRRLIYLGKQYEITEKIHKPSKVRLLDGTWDVANPDNCVVCGQAGGKIRYIKNGIHDVDSFTIKCRVHENHLRFIDASFMVQGKTDEENAVLLIQNASSKFKNEFDKWMKEQGNNKENVEKRFVTKKSSNEIKLLGTGDLK